MTGTQCGLFTHKSVPVIFESPCIYTYTLSIVKSQITIRSLPLEPPSSWEDTIKMVLGGNRLSGCGLVKNYVQLWN
jgi:hypothetical protein